MPREGMYSDWTDEDLGRAVGIDHDLGDVEMRREIERRLRARQREEHPTMQDHCLDCGSANVQVFSRVEKYDRPSLLEGEATPRDATRQREEEIRERIDKGQYATWRKGADSWAATDDVRWLLSEIDRLRARQREEGGGLTDEDWRMAIYWFMRHRIGEDEYRSAEGAVELIEEVARQKDATPQREGEREPVAWRYRFARRPTDWCVTRCHPREMGFSEEPVEIQPLYTEPPAEPDDAD